MDDPAELWPSEAHQLAEALVGAAYAAGWRPSATFGETTMCESAAAGMKTGMKSRDSSYDPETDLRRRHPSWSICTTDGLPFGVAGAVDHERRIVEVAVGLTRAQRRSTLAHEIVHIDLGHDGHQPAYIEHLVDAIAASRLFTRSDFENARARGTGISSDIARRLGVDHDVVLAWARTRRSVDDPDHEEGA